MTLLIMLFSLRLLLVFAISVAALPPSPHSIRGCKNPTMIEKITLESGVVATRYECEGLMDGGKRDACPQTTRVTSADVCVRLSPPRKHKLTYANLAQYSQTCWGVGFISTHMIIWMSEIEPIKYFSIRVFPPAVQDPIVTAFRTPSEIAVVSVAFQWIYNGCDDRWTIHRGYRSLSGTTWTYSYGSCLTYLANNDVGGQHLLKVCRCVVGVNDPCGTQEPMFSFCAGSYADVVSSVTNNCFVSLPIYKR